MAIAKNDESGALGLIFHVLTLLVGSERPLENHIGRRATSLYYYEMK